MPWPGERPAFAGHAAADDSTRGRVLANDREVWGENEVAVGQNQWYHFGVGAPPILVYFSGDWDVHWGYDLAFDPWPGE